ncbi:hypothetical protein ABPG72_018661 [Tetrahymena utriculariae]
MNTQIYQVPNQKKIQELETFKKDGKKYLEAVISRCIQQIIRAKTKFNSINLKEQSQDGIDQHPSSPKTDTIQADSIIQVIFLKRISQFTTKLKMYSLFDPKISLPITSSNLINQKKLEYINKDIDVIKYM